MNLSSLRSSIRRLTDRLPWHAQWFLDRIVLRSYVMGFVVSIALGSGYYLVFAKGNGQTQTSTSLSVVERRTIVSSIRAAGKVTFANEQQMKFNQKGTVKKVNLKLGDSVKHGQIIAELDKTSVLSDIRQVQLAIAASALQLQQLQNDGKKTVSDAQHDLAVSLQKLPSDLAAAERAVEGKQTELEQAKLDLQKQKSTELQSLATTAQGILADADKLLDSYYSVLTRSKSARPLEGNNSDLTIDNFLYNDPNVMHQVEFDYYDAVNAVYKMHDQYGETLATERDPKVLLRALSDAREVALAMNKFGESMYTMMQGATTDTRDFTVTSLNTLRTTVSTNRTTAAGLITDSETAQANLAAAASTDGGIPSVTLREKEDAVTTAENALKLAEENLKVLKTQTPGDLESKQQAFSNTSVNTDVSIKLKQNDIAQKSAALQKTRQSLDDYQLRAPFDGVITHMDYKVGDNLLSTGDTESLTLENPGDIVVTIPLDQVDVVRVRTGMTASISFDAIPGQQFQGALYQIDSTPIQQSGVVSYNVSVELPTPQGLTILSGMTATVTIETSRKENVVAVPNLGMKVQNGRTTVQKATGESVTVQTGVTDGKYTEILSGLQDGDSILSVNIATSTVSAKGSSSVGPDASMQLMRTLNGGGRPGGGATSTMH